MTSIRHCDEIAKDPADADIVASFGWERTQMGWTPERRYGHKNVILRDLPELRRREPFLAPDGCSGAVGMAEWNRS